MIYSQNYLQQYLRSHPTNLINDLLQLGHEVEEVINLQIDGLVIGEILSVENHPDSDHLHVCQVDVGNTTLQIVCGASNVYTKMKVVVSVVGSTLPNDVCIKTSIIRGIESQGMLCSYEELGLDHQFTNPGGDFIIELSADAAVGDDACSYLGLNDQVIDLSLTANRGDCLSYVGISRDINALMNCGATISNINYHHENPGINLNNASGCLLTIDATNLFAHPSLIAFLAKHKQRHLNYIYDMCVKMQLESGVCFNLYDISNIDLHEVCYMPLETPTNIELMVNHEPKTINLVPGTMVLMANPSTQPVILGIPGIGVNALFSVTQQTTSYLLDTIIPDPAHIRSVNQTLKIKNDNTVRSEKGIDVYSLIALKELITNFEPTCKIQCLAANLNYQPLNPINFNVYTTCFDVLGINIDPNQQLQMLANLGFCIGPVDNNGNCLISVPSWRFDIFNSHDLVEEIIRIYGVDNITSTFGVETLVSPQRLNHQAEVVTSTLSDILLKHQINDVITYSLISDNEFNEFNPLNKMPMTLMSPLSNDHKHYRHSLIPSLLNVCQYNLDRQANYVNYGEVANTYFNDLTPQLHFACAIGGIKAHKLNGNNEFFDFYDLKAIVEEFSTTLDLNLTIKSCSAIEILNPYAQALVYYQEQPIGFIGLKHPNYYKKIKMPVVLCELNLDPIVNNYQHKRTYQSISQLPIIKRNLTLLVPETSSYDEIITIFNDSEYLTNVAVSNIYRGANIKAGYYSISFELNFSQQTPLTKEDIESVVSKIVARAKKQQYIFNEG